MHQEREADDSRRIWEGVFDVEHADWDRWTTLNEEDTFSWEEWELYVESYIAKMGSW